MYKEERSSTREVYVVGFVPNCLIPKKRPCALDPFLHPLISEVEEIFINGKMICKYYNWELKHPLEKQNNSDALIFFLAH